MYLNVWKETPVVSYETLSRNLSTNAQEQDTQSPGRGMNRDPTEHKAGVLPTRPRRQVSVFTEATYTGM
jgi:hypothetical protein